MRIDILFRIIIFQILVSQAMSAFDVLAVSPMQNGIAVNQTPSILIEFNEFINPQSLLESSVIVHGSQSGYISSDAYTVVTVNNELSIDFIHAFFSGELVTVTLHNFTSSESSQNLTPFSWSFTIDADQGHSNFKMSAAFSLGIDSGPYSGGITNVICADMNLDGLLDIINTNYSDQSISISINLGDYQFSSSLKIPVGIYPTDLCVTDLDNDRDLDIACVGVGDGEDGEVNIIFNHGEENFSLYSSLVGGAEAGSITNLDINNDGYIDLAIGNTADYFTIIYLNDGSANFDRVDIPQNYHTQTGFAWGDFNNDGQFDLVFEPGELSQLYMVTQGSTAPFIWYPISGQLPYNHTDYISPGDFNGDSYLDLLLYNFENEGSSLLLNNGNSSLELIPFFPGEHTIGDFSSDGDLDVLAFHDAALTLYENDGSGNYSAVWNRFSPTSNLRALSSGDIDSDGDLDVIMASPDLIYVLKNCVYDSLLNPPSNLSGSHNGETIELDWHSSNLYEEQHHFVIVKGIESTVSMFPLATVFAPLTTYTDHEVEANTLYYYAVKSVDAGGNESEFSDTLEINTLQPVLPPVNLTGTTDLQSISLEWEASSPVVDCNYIIHKALNSASTLLPIDTILAPAVGFTDELIEVDQNYYYSVQAMDRLGNLSEMSTHILVSTFPPAFSLIYPESDAVWEYPTQTEQTFQWEAVNNNQVLSYEVIFETSFWDTSVSVVDTDSYTINVGTFPHSEMVFWHVIATDDWGGQTASLDTNSFTIYEYEESLILSMTPNNKWFYEYDSGRYTIREVRGLTLIEDQPFKIVRTTAYSSGLEQLWADNEYWGVIDNRLVIHNLEYGGERILYDQSIQLDTTWGDRSWDEGPEGINYYRVTVSDQDYFGSYYLTQTTEHHYDAGDGGHTYETEWTFAMGLGYMGYWSNEEPDFNLIGAMIDGVAYGDTSLNSVVNIDENHSAVKDFELISNFPNPFNPSTTIRYGLPEEANVSLVIYDIRGNLVQTLQSEHQSAGWYDVVWNGQAADGKTISTGIYFARLVAGDYSQVIKMLYLK